MHTRSLLMTGGFVSLLLVGTVLAQPGGGRPGRATPAGGAGHPTGEVPFVMPTTTIELPFATATRSAPIAGTNVPMRPTRTVTVEGGERGTRVPRDPLSTTPTFVPQGTLESAVQSLQETYDISISESFPASSVEAEAILASFASQYLGFNPSMVYAAQVATSSLDYDQISQLLLSFPYDISDTTTALLQSMDGTAYGGLYQDGVAMLYTGTCSGSPCSTTQGQMQFILQEGALGIYGTYTTSTVNDANAALALVRQTFPTLNSITFSAPTTEVEGYSFIGQTTTQANRTTTTTVYYVGTYSAPSYTTVYAMVAVGDVYAELIKP